MDLNIPQPFRFCCDIPLEDLPQVMPMVPFTIALMFKGDSVISPGLCFAAGDSYFHIKMEEGENGGYAVILRDIGGPECAPQGSQEIDTEIIEELRRRFEPGQDWENN